VIKCPNCGTMNEPGSAFCYQCGADIRNQAASGQQPQQPTAGFPPTGGTQPIYPPPPPGFPPSSSGSGFPPQPGQGFPSAPQPPGFPPPGAGYGSGYDPARQGWTPDYMTPPDAPKRRRWLWITLGLILGCILVCVIGGVLASKSDTTQDLLTSVVEYQTEEAN
jgi:hypothetical protein